MILFPFNSKFPKHFPQLLLLLNQGAYMMIKKSPTSYIFFYSFIFLCFDIMTNPPPPLFFFVLFYVCEYENWIDCMHL